MRKYFDHCAITVYAQGQTWGWNLFESDNAIGTSESQAIFISPEAAMIAAELEAFKVESKWKKFPSEFEIIRSFLDGINTNTKASAWMEALPGGEAWLVYYLKNGEIEPFCGTLHFDGIRGWYGSVNWIDILLVETGIK